MRMSAILCPTALKAPIRNTHTIHIHVEIGHSHHAILCTWKLSDFPQKYDLLASNPTQIL